MSYEEVWGVNRVMPEPDEEDEAHEIARERSAQNEFQQLLERYWTALEGEA